MVATFFFFRLFFLCIEMVAAVLFLVFSLFLDTQLENMESEPTFGFAILFTLKISSVLSIIISKTRVNGSFN